MITSPRNPRVKLVRALSRRRRVRLSERKLVLEGVRLIDDALQAGFSPDFALYRASSTVDSLAYSLVKRISESGSECIPVSDEIASLISQTEHGQGVVAVFPMVELPMPESLRLLLIADRISDPGNLGTMLRTALAAGVDLVLLAPGTTDHTAPKVVRAAMGAHFRLPIRAFPWHRIEGIAAGMRCYLADVNGRVPYYRVEWSYPSALIIGGEAHGPSEPARRVADETISIPMASGAESVNAAVAAGVILFEARRQICVGNKA